MRTLLYSPDSGPTLLRRPQIITLIIVVFTVIYLACEPSFKWPSWSWRDRVNEKPAPSWHRYVRAPPSAIIRPVAVLEEHTTGLVRKPQGLVNGSRPTVLVRENETDEVPSIVVDFGMNTVGILSIEFADADCAGDSLPGVRLAFSETLEHLSSTSDFSRSYNVISYHSLISSILFDANEEGRLVRAPRTILRRERIK